MSCAQTKGTAAATDADISEDDDSVQVIPFSRGDRVNILSKREGTVLGSICVVDAQYNIAPGWNNKSTKLGDYVLVSCSSVKMPPAAQNHVVEQSGWGNYLRKNWTYFGKGEDDDDDDDGLPKEGEGDEYEDLWLVDIINQQENFLVYRELLAKAKKKTPVSKQATNLGTPRPAKTPVKQPRARDNPSGSGSRPPRGKLQRR